MNVFQIVWFALIGVLLTGYIILDGFDLGIGFWYLFSKNEGERRRLLSSILPYWDANEVWLLTGGGAVFAAFPKVYATIFSGFYLALMLVLFALIFRAVSLEFRNHADEGGKRFWDGAFAIGSTLPALLLGVAMGNVINGLPLNAAGDFTGNFFTLLNPYSLLLGVTGLAMFAAHGALFATIKNPGDFAKKTAKWASNSGILYCILLSVCFVVTLFMQARFVANFKAHPVLFALPVLALVAAWSSMATIATGGAGKAMRAFLLSSGAMVAIIATIAFGLFPNFVPAINDPALNLTIANSSSSLLTLKTMLVLALIGVPIVLGYTVWVHQLFRGEASEEASY